MSLYTEIRTASVEKIPKMAMVILANIPIRSIYLIGYNQVQLFSSVQGNGPMKVC